MEEASGNLLENLPQSSSKEVFETLLKTGDVQIERIISFGQATPEGEWYDQASDEWVLLTKGQAKLLYQEGEEVELKPGDYLFIPRHKKHRVSYTSEDAIWLAIHIQ